MKDLQLTTRSSFFLLALLLQIFSVRAAAPTSASQDMAYGTIEGSSFIISFTKGNGANRIVVVRKNDAVSFLPSNGTSYPAAEFGTGTPVAAGEYVVYNGSANSINITGLAPNTVYHIAVFEYNGTGTSTEYLLTPLRGNRSTATTPASGAARIVANTTGGNFLRMEVVAGSGERRLVLMRKGAPVNATPTDLTSYSLNSQIGTGNIVVFNGNGSNNKFDLYNLVTSTDYHFAVFEYNGQTKPVYQAIAPTTAVITTNSRPSVNSSNFVTESKEGDRISIRYRLGDGRARIIVARKGQAVTAVPVDGEIYQGNLSFGGSGSSHLGDGQYVIYNGFNQNDAGSNSLSMTSLPRNTTYHFAIFEYDYDASGKPVYLTTNPAMVSGATHDEPTEQAKDMSFENITDKYATVKYKAGNGTGRLLIGRKGGPVNVTPTDLVTYSASAGFGYGTAINGDNFVLAESGVTAMLQRLQSSTEYHFAVFEYNGYLGRLYLDTDPARGQMTTAIRPSLPAAGMTFSNTDGNSIRLTWNNGNGKGRVIVARKGAAVTATAGEFGDLKDNQTYTANAQFGLGAQVKPGEFVVYNDSLGTTETRNSFTVTGLEPNTVYHFAVYEYGQLNGLLQYATASPATPGSMHSASASTSKPPTGAAGSFTINNITNRTMNVSWISGTGEMRIVLAKAGGPVDATPADLTDYTAAAFGEGTEIGNGNFVVYKGKGTSFTVTGLLPGVTYHFAEFEANGNLAPVFQNTAVTAPATGSKTTLERPTAAASNISFTNLTPTSFTVNWARGNGGKCLVVMRAANNVTAKPVDGQLYAANTAFGNGTDISTDGSKQYVVYNGDGTTVDITGLQPAETYYVTVYEYEELSLGTAYLTAQSPSAFKQIVAAPLSQASGLKVAWVNGGTVKLEWEAGTGQKRIVLAREGAEVNAVPNDNINYNPNVQFGAGQQIGTGNFVVFNGSGNSVSVSNLKPTKTYHFAVFEYNQFSSSPALYLASNPAKAQINIPNPLPVTWLSFVATGKSNSVVLEWKTTTEVKNKEFEVERSTDGRQFTKIGAVAASTQLLSVYSYQFTDALPGNGTVHYRLKQIDVDGNFSYSRTVQVKVEESQLLQVLENPVRSELRVKSGSSLMGSKLMVADASGRIVYNGTINTQLVKIAMGHLPAGIYYLKAVQINGNCTTVSFLHN